MSEVRPIPGEIPPILSLAEYAASVADFMPPPRFPVQRFDAIKPDERSGYVIKGLFPREGVVVVWGAPKSGKSFWVFDALMHVALNWEYRGQRVTPGPVVYCALEGAQGFKNRVEAFRLVKLTEAGDVAPPFFMMASSLSLVADQQQFVTEISVQLHYKKPIAVCIDTLNRSISGSENDDEAMGAYVRAADAIRTAFGCVVIIIHHSGYSAERPRGHSSLVGALDVQISVKRDAADNIVAELELAKDGPVGMQIASRLKVVEIGVDQDGDAITSCVVEPLDEAQGAVPAKGRANAKPLPASAQTALRALQKATAEAGEPAPTSNHIPAAVITVTVESWRTYAYMMGISASDEPRARRQAFQRASEALLAVGAIGRWGPHVWIVRKGTG
jgi:AAA domain